MFEAVGRAGIGASLSGDCGFSLLVLRASFNRTGGTSLGCNTVPPFSRSEGVCLSSKLAVTCFDFLGALNLVTIFTNFWEEVPSFPASRQLLALNLCQLISYNKPFVWLG